MRYIILKTGSQKNPFYATSDERIAISDEVKRYSTIYRDLTSQKAYYATIGFFAWLCEVV